MFFYFLHSFFANFSIVLDPFIWKNHLSCIIDDFLKTDEIGILLFDAVYETRYPALIFDSPEPYVPGENSDSRSARGASAEKFNSFIPDLRAFSAFFSNNGLELPYCIEGFLLTALIIEHFFHFGLVWA